MGIYQLWSLLENISGSALVANISLYLIAPLTVTSIPVGVAIAILKHRLFNIDILINRTLVYGSLSLTLALLYFAIVISLQALLLGLSGQSSEVAIVISTLLVAALFQPLRHRFQFFIDRRFYRRKYDAARTLAAFSLTLQQELDLQELNDRLARVVNETMQPFCVSLWLFKDSRIS